MGIALTRRQVLALAFVTRPALSDEGWPAFDKNLAAKLASLEVLSFACTPDAFRSRMAAAMRRDDINERASGQGLSPTRTRTRR